MVCFVIAAKGSNTREKNKFCYLNETSISGNLDRKETLVIQSAEKTTTTTTVKNTSQNNKQFDQLKRTFLRVRHVLRLFPNRLQPWPIYGQPTHHSQVDKNKIIITKYLIDVLSSFFFFWFHVWLALSVRRLHFVMIDRLIDWFDCMFRLYDALNWVNLSILFDLTVTITLIRFVGLVKRSVLPEIIDNVD